MSHPYKPFPPPVPRQPIDWSWLKLIAGIILVAGFLGPCVVAVVKDSVTSERRSSRDISLNGVCHAFHNMTRDWPALLYSDRLAAMREVANRGVGSPVESQSRLMVNSFAAGDDATAAAQVTAIHSACT